MGKTVKMTVLEVAHHQRMAGVHTDAMAMTLAVVPDNLRPNTFTTLGGADKSEAYQLVEMHRSAAAKHQGVVSFLTVAPGNGVSLAVGNRAQDATELAIKIHGHMAERADYKPNDPTQPWISVSDDERAAHLAIHNILKNRVE